MNKAITKNMKKGFTLIELLVVIAIIAVLAVVVFVALNPAGRLQDARDSRRVTDVQNILTAIHQCIVDEDGVLASCLESNGSGLTEDVVYEITNEGVATGCNTVCTEVVDPSNCATIQSELAPYLVSLPVDPNVNVDDTPDRTGYSVEVNTNNIVTVTACGAEGDDDIQASR